MNRITLFERIATSVALFCSASIFITITGCGGGNSSGGGSGPIPSASISETSSTMNAGATQAITAAVTNPSGVITCSFGASVGSFGTASLSGNTCSATYTAPTTMTQVTTATLSFTGGGASASANLTINPVAQTVSLPSALNVDLDGTLALTTANVTASASCPTTSVTFTVVPVTTDITHAAGSTLASWSADPNHMTFGSILGGNALLEDNTNTYKVTATCGSSTGTSTLTVNDVAPTLSSISPPTVNHSSPSTTFTLTGTGFSAQSSTHNLSEWFGTLASGHFGACPTTEPTSLAGTAWFGSVQLQQTITGNIGVGTFSYYVVNAPTASGTGGGWACLTNAFVVTANFVTGTGRAIVTVDPGTSSTPGTATVVKNGAATRVALGFGAGSPVAQGDLVYVPNRTDHTITQIDTDAMSSQTISTGVYSPVLVAASPNAVLVAVTAANGDASQGAILALRGGYFSKVADAPYFSDLAIQGQNMLWLSTPKGSTTAEVHQLDLSGGSERVVRMNQTADSLKIMSYGTLLAFHVGDANALVLDPFTLAERGSVSFAKGLYGFSGDYATLSDGSIGKVVVSADGAGNPVAQFTMIDSAVGNYGSFAVDTSQAGVAKVYSVYYGDGSISAPRVHVVPMAQ